MIVLLVSSTLPWDKIDKTISLSCPTSSSPLHLCIHSITHIHTRFQFGFSSFIFKNLLCFFSSHCCLLGFDYFEIFYRNSTRFFLCESVSTRVVPARVLTWNWRLYSVCVVFVKLLAPICADRVITKFRVSNRFGAFLVKGVFGCLDKCCVFVIKDTFG